MNSFLDYLRLRRYEESGVGDLARDLIFDFDEMCSSYGAPSDGLGMPGSCTLEEPDSIASLIEHLGRHGACDGAYNAAALAWADYIRWSGLEDRYAVLSSAA